MPKRDPGSFPTAPEDTNPLRRFAFYAALATIFTRLTVLPELLQQWTGANTYLLYVIAPPALLGCAITGGFGRLFKARAAWLWTGLLLWMIMAIPFSSWMGASLQMVLSYARTDFICLFVIGGLVVTWSEVGSTLTLMGAAGFAVLVVVRFFAQPDNLGRLTLNQLGEQGTLANSNDIAAHLVLLLPFMFYLVLKPGRTLVFRLLITASIFYGLSVILGTASRGAMVGLSVMSIFVLFRASGLQRLAVLCVVPVLALTLVVVSPEANLNRLGSLFSREQLPEGSDEAGESVASRAYLLRKSIEFTFQNPIFGVGPSQFANYEGKTSRALGEHGNWHETHNSYTQVSSECGLPALALMVGALLCSFTMVNRTYKAARSVGNTPIAHACMCYLASFIGYATTITFLACGYRFTLPLMVGLAIAIHFAAAKQMAASARQAVR